MEPLWMQIIIPVGSAMLGGAVMFGIFKQKIKTLEKIEAKQAEQIETLDKNKVNHEECQRCRQETCRRIDGVKHAVEGLEKETKESRQEIQREIRSNKDTVLEKFNTIATILGGVQQFMKEHT